MLNIIYLSQNISSLIKDKYVSASYQQNLIDELSLKTNLYNYGPGYENFDYNDKLNDIVQKSSFSPDLLIFGHNWLMDDNKNFNSLMPNLDLVNTQLMKVGILNKEYINLEKKLEYFKEKNFDLFFSHLHENHIYEKITDIKSIFIPFACNHRLFQKLDKKKEIDIFFSGILKNPSILANQSNFRVNCLNKIFHNIFDEPIKKKKKLQ